MASKDSENQRLNDLVNEIVRESGAFCRAHLNGEYAELCRELAVEIREECPSLLSSGRAKSWTAAVVYTVARVNFLFDPNQTPHMSATTLCLRLDVSQANASAKSTQIMDALEIDQMDPAWCLPSLLPMNPFVSMAAAEELFARLAGEAPNDDVEFDSRSGFPVVGDPRDRPSASPPGAEFEGLWDILEIEGWHPNDLVSDGPAQILVEANGLGAFRTGLVRGELHGKTAAYAEFTRFEFTWQSMDEVDFAFGSGWLQREEDDLCHGELRFHMGEDFSFAAEKQSRERTPRFEDPTEAARAPETVCQLKVTLRDIRPPIWRRILVAADTPLDELHGILRRVMGWEGGHLHRFTVGNVSYGTPDPSFPQFDLGDLDERQARLSDALTSPGSKMIYEYDFGDGWTHEVLLEKSLPGDPDRRYPVCVTGKRACPPEDCGGPWGYAELLKALSDTAHPSHEELYEWMGGPIDPEAFELPWINAELEAYTDYLKRSRNERDPL